LPPFFALYWILNMTNTLTQFITTELMKLILPAQERDAERQAIAGQERRTVLATAENTQKHCVFFAGNGLDINNCYDTQTIPGVVQEENSTTYHYWNYPGVGRSQGESNHTEDLVNAGYQRVQDLLKQDIKPENITLYGLSLGGGVAARVARMLHDEGKPVNLIIDNSFASISAFMPAQLHANLRASRAYPLITSVLACSTLGIAFGLLLANTIYALGMLLAQLTACIPCLPDSIPTGINTIFDVLASAVGGLIAVLGVLAGAVTGLILGALLSVQIPFTRNTEHTPYTLPMEPAVRALLHTTVGELNSCYEVQQIMRLKKRGTVSIYNSQKDTIIREQAALATALSKTPIYHHINVTWFNTRGHMDTRNEANIDHDKSHARSM
jgi:hypothetical protein